MTAKPKHYGVGSLNTDSGTIITIYGDFLESKNRAEIPAALALAAPDLLIVAREVAQWVRAYPELNQRCAELAEAAIAKAEGGK